MYELIEDFKKLGKKLRDDLTGKTVEQEINNQIQLSRNLSPGPILEPYIVLQALRVYNKVKAYGIGADELDEIIRNYLQKGK